MSHPPAMAPPRPPGSDAGPVGSDTRPVAADTGSPGSDARPLGQATRPPELGTGALGSRRPSQGPSGSWRRERLPFPLADDVSGEDEWEAEHRRHRMSLLAAVVTVTVAIVIVFFVAHFSSTDLGGLLERPLRWLGTDSNPAPASRSEQNPLAPTNATPLADSPAPTNATPLANSPAPTAPPAASDTAMKAPDETKPRSPSAAEPPAPGALPPRWAIERRAEPTQEDQASRSPRAVTPSSRTSEERMAAFLIEELGPASAAEKARSTATWYEPDRPEHAYWRRVADAIERRGGS